MTERIVKAGEPAQERTGAADFIGIVAALAITAAAVGAILGGPTESAADKPARAIELVP